MPASSARNRTARRLNSLISAAETRVRLIDRLRAAQRARLAERQGPIIRLTAALQTMARRPTALALVEECVSRCQHRGDDVRGLSVLDLGAHRKNVRRKCGENR